jgi:Tol biopolymer transport system component
MIKRSIVLVFYLIFSSSLGLAQPTAIAPTDITKTWKLAFVREGNIWVANGDGSNQKLLITNAESPSWSPDRKQIAFSRDCNLWIAESDGSKQRPLTNRWKKGNPDMCVFQISWNPRNPFITFSHAENFWVGRIDGTNDLSYILPWRKNDIVKGTSIFDVEISDAEQKKLIVRFDIYEGGTSFNFTNHDNPAWSNSGGTLAFTRNGDIWIAEMQNKAGSNWDATRLAAVASYDEPTWRGSRENHGATHLSWSPDDKYLTYSNQRLQGSGFAELHVLEIKSGNDCILATDALDPSFSPDGQLLAYWSNYYQAECGGGRTLCVWAVSVDGKTKRILVTNAIQPAW